MADDKRSESTSSNAQSSQHCISPQTVTSASSSPLEFSKSYNELCVPDENLPSKNIAELWQKPLKLSQQQCRKSKSPRVQKSGKKNNQHTPNRKSVLPPTKLVFDHLDSDQPFNTNTKLVRSSNVAYRRSMSLPGDTCGDSGTRTPAYNPKRLKLGNDETSPYEDMINSKSVLQASGQNAESSSSTSTLTPAVRKLFSKSQSDNNVLSSCMKTAVDKIEEDPTLIGDASTSYILPFTNNGKNPDLKEITGETLAKLLEAKEDYSNVSFKIIDCRFPYEFAGGHIRGAVNLYTKNQIEQELLNCKLTVKSPSSGSEKGIREILIFHCEFSSHRGPTLCRHLRRIDRASNVTSYPFLYYPEVYVLYEGYKKFFESFPHLCDPQSYVPMAHPEHADLYRQYKSETKL